MALCTWTGLFGAWNSLFLLYGRTARLLQSLRNSAQAVVLHRIQNLLPLLFCSELHPSCTLRSGLSWPDSSSDLWDDKKDRQRRRVWGQADFYIPILNMIGIDLLLICPCDIMNHEKENQETIRQRHTCRSHKRDGEAESGGICTYTGSHSSEMIGRVP
jgi:hypothetical protein